MGFDIDKATRELVKVPTFKFKKIGHKFLGTIVDVDDEVEQDGDKGTETYIVLQVKIDQAKGGDLTDPTDKDSDPVDTPAGEIRSLWLRYKRDGKDAYSPMTRAVAAAVKDSGSRAIEVGATIRVEHDKVGDKPKDPTHSRAKLFSVSYTPPVKSAAIADLDDF